MHCAAKKGSLMNLFRPDSWQFGVNCLKQTRIVDSIDCLLWWAVVHVDYVITVPEYSQLKLPNFPVVQIFWYAACTNRFYKSTCNKKLVIIKKAIISFACIAFATCNTSSDTCHVITFYRGKLPIFY